MKKIFIALIIALAMCVSGLVVSLLFSSCNKGENDSFRKDITGNWVCIGHDKEQERMAFCIITFNEFQSVKMFIGKDTYFGSYGWKGNKVECDFVNGEEKAVFDVKDIYVGKVVNGVNEWKMHFDLYLDDEFYMEFECTKTGN